ncbi:MAG: zinc ribbon domain-containing protein [Candidatus Saccharicenans sp.]
MFFFIGGISPKLKKLEDQARICPACGQSAVYQVRLNHYLMLFFIPIFPVKKGKPFFLCENCGHKFSEGETGSPSLEDYQARSPRLCPNCGRLIDRGFRFCPYCGHPLK